MTHLNEFINNLGGRLKVATALNISPETVRKWKYVGIPPVARVNLAVYAQKNELSLPVDFLTNPYKWYPPQKGKNNIAINIISTQKKLSMYCLAFFIGLMYDIVC